MKREFNKWLKDRPKIIKKLGKKFPPWFKYRIKKTKQNCEIYSYSEDGTITVTTKEPLTGLDYNVFGLKPKDIERI